MKRRLLRERFQWLLHLNNADSFQRLRQISESCSKKVEFLTKLGEHGALQVLFLQLSAALPLQNCLSLLSMALEI